MKKQLISILSVLTLATFCLAEQELKDVERQSKLGFLGGTTNTLTQLAQDLFSRSTTSSQVLSLNLTNLVILLVVKALIFGAGSLGFGGGDHLGRSVENPSERTVDDSIVTESELLLMLSYLKGDLTQKYGCLHFAACQDPKKAKEYLTASNMLVKGVNLFNLSANGKKYEKMLEETDEAIKFGAKGYDCSVRYTCADKS